VADLGRTATTPGSVVPQVGDGSGLRPQQDPGVAHPARVYGYWLGGEDHYPADREVAEKVIRHRPGVVIGARANRAFLRRVTWYAARGCGIEQILDIGVGLPAPGATHEIAQQANPDCRIVYADNDPIVLAQAQSRLTAAPGRGSCDYIDADVRDPAALLAKASASLDLSKPVAVLLLAILHFLSDKDDPAWIVAELAAGLAPGSLLAISHVTADYASGPVTEGTAAYNARVPISLYPRTRGEVTALFGGLSVQWPGVVAVTRWRPSLQEAPGRPVDIYGGLARLPHPGDNGIQNAPLPFAAARTAADADDAELAACASRFLGHRFWRENIGSRIRYVARSRSLAINPHTVVSDSLDDLCAVLTADQDVSSP
jgi:hypothetical protein